MAAAASVFISYSSKDADIVNRLKMDMANAGVAVWLDHEQLPQAHGIGNSKCA